MARSRVDRSSQRERSTAERLVTAAAAEFREHGYGGTDSNKIARRAGFAPQTFYRWYRDKAAIFIAVYLAWEEEERAMLEGLIQKAASSRALAAAIVKHHRAHARFRRSLRQLALSEPEIRASRAASRKRQIERIRAWTGRAKQRESELAAALFEIERLADAVAEGEWSDLGLDERLGVSAIARRIAALREAP